MTEAWQALVGILAVLGALFCTIAAIGVARLPDALTRMHASSKAGTLGCGLILAAVALFFPQVDVLARVLAAILFLTLTTPVSAHMIGRAIHASRERLWSGTVRDELRGTKDDPGRRLPARDPMVAQAQPPDGGTRRLRDSIAEKSADLP